MKPKMQICTLKTCISSVTYRPTKFSNTLLFPALWLPTTAIWGRSMVDGCPIWAKASWILFITGIRSSIPLFPILQTQKTAIYKTYYKLRNCHKMALEWSQRKSSFLYHPEFLSRGKSGSQSQSVTIFQGTKKEGKPLVIFVVYFRNKLVSETSNLNWYSQVRIQSLLLL